MLQTKRPGVSSYCVNRLLGVNIMGGLTHLFVMNVLILEVETKIKVNFIVTQK